jgi:hypothetical protein
VVTKLPAEEIVLAVYNSHIKNILDVKSLFWFSIGNQERRTILSLPASYDARLDIKLSRG